MRALLRNFAARFGVLPPGVLYLPLMTKAKAYFQLLKFRLALTVAFSSAIGYLLGAQSVDVGKAILVLLGGLAVTGSANTINRLAEACLRVWRPRPHTPAKWFSAGCI